jgi:hypothetical protein
MWFLRRSHWHYSWETLPTGTSARGWPSIALSARHIPHRRYRRNVKLSPRHHAPGYKRTWLLIASILFYYSFKIPCACSNRSWNNRRLKERLYLDTINHSNKNKMKDVTKLHIAQWLRRGRSAITNGWPAGDWGNVAVITSGWPAGDWGAGALLSPPDGQQVTEARSLCYHLRMASRWMLCCKSRD